VVAARRLLDLAAIKRLTFKWMHLCAGRTNEEGPRWSEDHSAVRGEIVPRIGLVQCSRPQLVVDFARCIPRLQSDRSADRPALRSLRLPDAQVGFSSCDNTVRCCRIAFIGVQVRRLRRRGTWLSLSSYSPTRSGRSRSLCAAWRPCSRGPDSRERARSSPQRPTHYAPTPLP
jgi:hypothetical protein